eukprot:COSAG01_NODE_1028_length_12028_cov_5.688826_13_plen_434_part_00
MLTALSETGVFPERNLEPRLERLVVWRVSEACPVFICMASPHRHYERDTVSELDWGALFTKGASCHEWASLLKLWLRELAEPIIPSSLYDRAVSIGRDSGKGGRAGALDEGAGLGHFMQQMSPTGAAVISRIATFLSTMDVSHTHMPVENLAMVFTPCLLRHTDMLVFMKNKDYEIEFTRRLLQYAAASGPTPALASQERPRALSWEHRAPQDDVVPLSPAPSDPAVDLAPAAAAATSSSTSAGGDDGQQRQQLSVLRRERSLESMAAARTALSSERTSRRVAEAEAVAQHVEVQKLTAELDATVSLIETLSDASAQQGGGGGGPPTTATGEELGQTSQRLQPAEPLSTAAEPQADPEVAAVSARALWAFEASGEGQLSVGVGQIVDVQQAPADSEWWLCSLGGEAGWLPVCARPLVVGRVDWKIPTRCLCLL